MNELLMLLVIFLSFGIILFVYKLQGIVGLYYLVPIFYILANVQVIKQINLFNYPIALGDVSFCSVVLISDLITENYNKKMAKKVIYVGFISMIMLATMMYITIKFIPNNEDFAQKSLESIFLFTPRILFASLTSYFISQNLEIFLYNKIRGVFPSTKDLWIRNNVSGLVSSLVDSLIVSFLMFYGEFEVMYVFKIAMSSYAIKAVISVMDTPFVYFSKKIKPKELEIIKETH